MSSQIVNPFCPIYREARETAPWKTATSAHAGLLFDKFAAAWRYKSGHPGEGGTSFELEFDKGDSRKDGANDWLNGFKRAIGNEHTLNEACARQRRLVERLEGRVISLTNTERFVTGMGREHPLENGFAWHHTLGVPYLPGSSVKGLLRAWLREEDGKLTKDWRGHDTWEETPELKQQFGSLGQTGHVILLDMLPTSPPQLDVDVMTPHYGDYYQKGAIPGDWHSPVPISFLTVAPGCSWQLGIIPAGGVRSLDEETLNSLAKNLLEAMEVCGAGAKTAVGYGRFELDTEAVERIRLEQEAQQQREQAARERAAQQAEFEASVAGNSEPLQRLKQLQRDESWVLSPGDQNLINALQRFGDEHPEPPEDCLDWIRNLLESIPGYKGVWNQPDAMKGKKGDKPKYPSAAIRKIVTTLNPPN